MDTITTLSRLSLHHCSTSYAKVALNIALLTLGDVQARKMEASWSLNPVLPSSNSLSDSSTISHSTLRNSKITCSYWTGRSGTLHSTVRIHEKSPIMMLFLIHFIKWEKKVQEKLAEKHKCSSVTSYKSSKTSCISSDRGFHCTCWKMWKGLGSYVLFIKCIIFFLTSSFFLLVNSSYYILSITLTQAGRQYAPKGNNQSYREQNVTVMDDTDCQPDRIQNHQR